MVVVVVVVVVGKHVINIRVASRFPLQDEFTSHSTGRKVWVGYFGGGQNQNIPKFLLRPKYPALLSFAFFWNVPGSVCSDLTHLNPSPIHGSGLALHSQSSIPIRGRLPDCEYSSRKPCATLLVQRYFSNTASSVFYGIACQIRLIEFAASFTTFEDNLC